MKTLTESQKAYREFLKTDFWKALSLEKRKLVGKCEECGSTENLQAHHVTYPKDWYDSTLEHLKVLCRTHHAKAHGIFWTNLKFYIFQYRSRDERFNRFIHFVDYLRARVLMKSIPLKKREIIYLNLALESYPATKRDGCMEFHVNQTLSANPSVN